MSLVITAGLRIVFALVGLATFSVPVAAQDASTVKIGKETKKTMGVVQSLENGDVACYLNLKDEKGKEFTELGDFDICFQKPSIIGKRVSLKYRLENVLADECQGNPECKKSKKAALVVAARIVDGRSDAKATTSRAASASH
ncbi:MAG: hypothetical protein LH481_10015 [Burkholderiales bacterium]|nr:hypothetical protein [Burkholderiales bacterium]